MGEYIRLELHDIIGTSDIVCGATDEEIETKIRKCEVPSLWSLVKTAYNGPSTRNYSVGTYKEIMAFRKNEKKVQN